ncbi:MAG: leucine-rich repeat domain-containing protein, partial [Paludibacteraceae bacterium]|nr:leucine-rich repeat domain-containing protein [Paludibacteraceae bacterium]
MKQKFLTLILVLTVGIGTLSASNTSVGGIWYDFNSSTKTATVTYRGSVVGSYLNAYSGSVVIPSSVTYNGTTYSVVSIGEDAFVACKSLSSVTIPNCVTSIGWDAFFGCSSLSSINVDSNNPNYSSVDGVLFNKDKTTLVAYPEGKQGAYTIPNSVTSIGGWAFQGCSSLTSITIPNSVTSIEIYAFQGCTSLTSVAIPESVTS